MKIQYTISLFLALLLPACGALTLPPPEPQKPIVLATIDGKPVLMSNDPILKVYLGLERAAEASQGMKLNQDAFKADVERDCKQIAQMKFGPWYLARQGWDTDAEYQKKLKEVNASIEAGLANFQACIKSGRTDGDCDQRLLDYYKSFGAHAKEIQTLEGISIIAARVIKKKLIKPIDVKQFYLVFQQDVDRYAGYFSKEERARLFKDGESFKPFEKLSERALDAVKNGAEFAVRSKADEDYRALEEQFIKLGNEKEMGVWLQGLYLEHVGGAKTK